MIEREAVQKSSDSAGRNRLVSRVVLVAGVIVALLAGLLIFENKQTLPSSEGEAVLEAPLKPPRLGVSVSASSAAALPEALQHEISAAPDSVEPALPESSAPVLASPAVPLVPEGSVDVAAGKSPSASPPDVSRGVQPRTGRALVTESPRAPAPTPLSSVGGGVSGALQTPPELGRFVLQLGVFSNPDNAQELKGKLKQAGIPAQLETRVQVGPFANREEALRAQDKLRQLGLGNGMLVTTGKRP